VAGTAISLEIGRNIETGNRIGRTGLTQKTNISQIHWGYTATL